MVHLCPVCNETCHCQAEENNEFIPTSFCTHCNGDQGLYNKEPDPTKWEKSRLRKWLFCIDIVWVFLVMIFAYTVAMYQLFLLKEFAHAAVIMVLCHIMLALMHIGRKL